MMKKIKYILFKNKYICPIIIFAFFCIIFLAGSFSSNSNIDAAALYISNISSKHTFSKSIPVIAESTNSEKKSVLIDTATEYRFLHGIFGGGNKAYFANTVNADKKETVICPTLNNTVNYSFLYAESGFRNKKQEGSPYYRHEFYPINLMFQGEHRHLSGSFSFLYISQSQADIILDNNNLEHNENNYESLLGTGLKLIMNNKEYLWVIEDIYIETGVYYSDIHDAIGDFFIGYNEYPDGFKKQAIYFLNNSKYQNSFFLEHIVSTFDSKSIALRFMDHTLNSAVLLDIFNKKNVAFSAIFCSFSLICIAFLFIYCHFNKRFNKPIEIMIYFIAIMLPWIVFKLISLVTNSLLFFSTLSNNIYLIAIIVIEIFVMVSFVFNNYLKKGETFEKKSVEINI